MKTKILILFAILILITLNIGTIQAELVYDYGNYSVKGNVTISACFSVNVDVLYANITKPDNIDEIVALSCGGTGYCQPSWNYCIGIFKNTNVSGIYNVSFYSDRYELSSSFKGFFTVFERTFLNITSPKNNAIINNKTIIINGLTNGTNVSIIKGNENFTAIVVNGTFSFPLNLTEGENKINVTSYGKYRYPNSTILRIILDTIPPLIILNSPQNNSYIRPGTLLNFSFFDEHLNKILINGKETNTTLIDTGGWSDGVYHIKIYANDTAGNENNKTFTFIIESERRTDEKVQEIKCNSTSWRCGSWSECSDGKQKKTCTNDCGDDKMEIQMCLPLPFSGEKPPTKEPNFVFPPPPEVDIGMPPGFNKSSNDSSDLSNLSIIAKNTQQNDSDGIINNETPFKKDNESNNESKSTTSNQTNNALENVWGIFNNIFENISKWIKWYYLLPLFLIPLILFFLLKNNVVADMEFLQKVKEEDMYNILQDFKNIYVTPDTCSKVLGWNRIINLKTINLNENGRKYLEEFGDEILALAKQVNAKKILTENDLREDLCKKKGFKTFRIKDLETV